MNGPMERLAGALINEVVRIGATVRRRALVPMDRSVAEAVLVRLEEAGFDGAPRFLGHDDDGRQVLTYVEGEVRPAPLDDDIETLLRLVRRFHDAAPGICHNDLSPRNTVWRPVTAGGGPVFIDWDLAAPGEPIQDVAHACWQFLDIGPARSVDDVASGLQRAADAYGLDAAGRAALVGEIAGWQQRCADGIEERAARGEAPFLSLVDRGAVDEIRAARRWVLEHAAAFRSALRRVD